MSSGEPNHVDPETRFKKSAKKSVKKSNRITHNIKAKGVLLLLAENVLL